MNKLSSMKSKKREIMSDQSFLIKAWLCVEWDNTGV